MHLEQELTKAARRLGMTRTAGDGKTAEKRKKDLAEKRETVRKTMRPRLYQP